ncbi:actin-related protein 5 [Paragonimus westermani]|uniref:Actin-related protein 5 n=1 Tax=Paragonimus westermani TaxID=34504 RepID=A0A5J4NH83_9TREM|nr:actin-related protein 5 [Paragonimus westermani]
MLMDATYFVLRFVCSLFTVSTSSASSPQVSECLVISLGHQNTHLIPLIPNLTVGLTPFQPLFSAARRLHVGGAHISWLLQRFLQLKYTCHTERLTFGLSEYLIHNFGSLATNYRQDLNQWHEQSYRDSHALKVQLPFVQSTMDELNAAADRKRAQSMRMQHLHRRRHIDQLDTACMRLNKLLALEDLFDQPDSPDSLSANETSISIKRELARLDLHNHAELVQEIKILQSTITRLEQQIASCPSPNTAVPGSTICEEQTAGSEGHKTELFDFSILADLSSNLDTLRTAMNEATGRHKRAFELLGSLALPAAVQAQMVATPFPADSKLSDSKLKQVNFPIYVTFEIRTLLAFSRIRLAHELESNRGTDFLVTLTLNVDAYSFPLQAWLIRLRHQRLKIAKRRTVRQSRIDLATEIGLHSTPLASNEATGSSGDGSIRTNISSVTSGAFVPNGQSRPETTSASITNQNSDRIFNMNANADSKGPLTERRRMQLEKIRAMAAELKPTRGKSVRGSLGKTTARDGRGAVSRRSQRARGHGMTRGRGRGRTVNLLNKLPASNPAKQLECDQDDPELTAHDQWLTEACKDMDEIEATPTVPSFWDIDAEDSTDLQMNLDESDSQPTVLTATKSSVATYFNSPAPASVDTGDESETERDQLAVLDSLMVLYDPEVSKDLGTADMKVSPNEFYQIHVGTELQRSCEVIFKPSFMGSPEAGLGECCEFVLRDVRNSSQRELTFKETGLWPRRIFLTGGLASLPGFSRRIYTELRPLLPCGPEFDNIEVLVADNPRLDAWRGARRWALSETQDIYVTRKMYDELGADYLVEHSLSNRSWISAT